jgi:hypothetical protein
MSKLSVMNTRKVQEWAEKIGQGVVVGIIVVILGALLRGDPLKGLSRAGLIWQVIVSRTIPVWLFLVVVLFAFYTGRLLVQQHKTDRLPLSIVWHEEKSFWHMGALRGEPAMQILVEASFTGREEYSVEILSAQAVGAKTKMDLLEPIICPLGQTIRRTRLMIFAQPPLAAVGSAWTGKILLTDQHGRKYKSPRLTIEYRG